MDIVASTQLPISYRQEIVAPVMQCFQAGESCSIVGIAGTGKSNLMRQLARSDVQREFLRDQRDGIVFCLVDFNGLAEVSEWGFWDLLLHRLAVLSLAEDVGTGLGARLADLHQQATASRDELAAQRCFETAVSDLCADPQRRLVLLFDAFDEVWRSLRCRPFQVLRALRDEFKYRLSFVVASRDILARLRGGVDHCHDFYEVVTLHTFGLGPHTEADALNQIERLSFRKGRSLTPIQVNGLMELTGRHPGLLKAAFWVIADDKVGNADFVTALVQESGVRGECDEMWKSLGEDERATLIALATDRMPAVADQTVLQRLRLKGLLSDDSHKPFCELFRAYIQVLAPLSPMRHSFAIGSGQVIVEGKPVPEELTKMELSLLGHLFSKRGEVCGRAELMHVIYPDETWTEEDALYDRRLDTIVRRLRNKIEPDRQQPRYVLTVRDRGYKLAVDDEDEGIT